MDTCQLKNWLNMAVLDLQESKQTGAVALEQARVLLEEKELLKEKLKIQHDLWDLEKKQLEEALTHAKRDHESKNIVQAYEIAGLNISIGSQQQEALCFKLRLEGAVDEVELLSSRLQILGVQLQEKEVQLCEANERHLRREAYLKYKLATEKRTDDVQKKASNMPHLLDDLKRKHEVEVQRLRNEQVTLSLKRKQEVSALIREKNFVWEQLKRMEDDYSNRLGTKQQELKSAVDSLQKLQLRVDELQKAHDEKTVEATVLRINVQAAEEELRRLREELLQLKPVGHAGDNQEFKSLVLRNSKDLIPAASDLDRKLISFEEVDRQLETSEQKQQIVEIKAEESKNKQDVLISDDSEATKLLVEKEEELNAARKLMDELRLENQNLRLLYADLEGQFKDKQKPEKANRESAKDATTRNLTAELEAVAANQASPKASRDSRLLRRSKMAQRNSLNLDLNHCTKLKAGEGKQKESLLKMEEAQANNKRSQRGRSLLEKRNAKPPLSELETERKTRNFSSQKFTVGRYHSRCHTDPPALGELKRRRQAPDSSVKQVSQKRGRLNGDGSSSLKILSPKDPNVEIKEADNNEQDPMQVSQQPLETKSVSTNNARFMKNRLFSSVFAIPKILAGT